MNEVIKKTASFSFAVAKKEQRKAAAVVGAGELGKRIPAFVKDGGITVAAGKASCNQGPVNTREERRARAEIGQVYVPVYRFYAGGTNRAVGTHLPLSTRNAKTNVRYLGGRRTGMGTKPQAHIKFFRSKIEGLMKTEGHDLAYYEADKAEWLRMAKLCGQPANCAGIADMDAFYASELRRWFERPNTVSTK